MKTLILSHFKPYPPNHRAARRIWDIALNKAKGSEKALIMPTAEDMKSKKNCVTAHSRKL